ncbi:MAG: PQQ-binding-like beta-propeller repeat protein, partial [Thermoplasmata archaeon]|nr:PQQ-binding-like beta-propeller repeat protein [Thermoplasmata archaeon]
WRFRTENSVRDISISAGGEYLVVGSNDRRVYFLDREGNLLWKYRTGAAVYTVAMSMRGEYAAAGSYDRKVYFFNREGELLWEFETGSAVRDVEMSTKGKLVAAGSYDHHLYFLDRSGRLLWRRKMQSSVEKVAISPSGDEIAAGSEGEVSLFDQRGGLLWRQSTGTYDIRGLEISTQGGSIICGSRDNEVLYFEKGGGLLWRYKTPQWVETVAVGSRGRYIAAGLRNGLLYLFDSLEFFEGYLKEAKRAIVRLENYGTGSARARALYENAEQEFHRENYMKALALAIRARTMAEKSVQESRPVFSYIVKAESPFAAGKWNPIVFKVANTGNADSQDVLIRFTGPFRVRGERKIEVLRAGTFRVLRLDLRPMNPGEQRIELAIQYFDFGGREYTETDGARVHVREELESRAPEADFRQVIFRRMPVQAHARKPEPRTEPRCPNCNRNVRAEWLVCPYCATPIK